MTVHYTQKLLGIQDDELERITLMFALQLNIGHWKAWEPIGSDDWIAGTVGDALGVYEPHHAEIQHAIRVAISRLDQPLEETGSYWIAETILEEVLRE